MAEDPELYYEDDHLVRPPTTARKELLERDLEGPCLVTYPLWRLLRPHITPTMERAMLKYPGAKVMCQDLTHGKLLRLFLYYEDGIRGGTRLLRGDWESKFLKYSSVTAGRVLIFKWRALHNSDVGLSFTVLRVTPPPPNEDGNVLLADFVQELLGVQLDDSSDED